MSRPSLLGKDSHGPALTRGEGANVVRAARACVPAAAPQHERLFRAHVGPRARAETGAPGGSALPAADARGFERVRRGCAGRVAFITSFLSCSRPLEARPRRGRLWSVTVVNTGKTGGQHRIARRARIAHLTCVNHAVVALRRVPRCPPCDANIGSCAHGRSAVSHVAPNPPSATGSAFGIVVSVAGRGSGFVGRRSSGPGIAASSAAQPGCRWRRIMCDRSAGRAGGASARRAGCALPRLSSAAAVARGRPGKLERAADARLGLTSTLASSSSCVSSTGNELRRAPPSNEPGEPTASPVGVRPESAASRSRFRNCFMASAVPPAPVTLRAPQRRRVTFVVLMWSRSRC
jgi:hypothetical protein